MSTTRNRIRFTAAQRAANPRLVPGLIVYLPSGPPAVVCKARRSEVARMNRDGVCRIEYPRASGYTWHEPSVDYIVPRLRVRAPRPEVMICAELGV